MILLRLLGLNYMQLHRLSYYLIKILLKSQYSVVLHVNLLGLNKITI